jgi:DNA-binding response OmpR family regulator
MGFVATLNNAFGPHREMDSRKEVHVSSRSGVLERGDFRLELDSRVAYVCGRPLNLNEAEFDLLEFLMTHQKKLVTPPTLASGEVSSSGDSSNLLRAAISLRKKLEAASVAKHYLRTEPWILCSFNPVG